MIRSIVAQLTTQQANISPALESLFDGTRDRHSPPPLNDLLEVLPKLLQEFNSVYLVIDALDECVDLKELLYQLEMIKKWKQETLHIIVTSRQEPNIEDKLSDLITDKVSLCEAMIKDDITLYLNAELAKCKWPSGVRKSVKKSLSHRSEGM